VTPAPGDAPIALRLTSPDEPCFSSYVHAVGAPSLTPEYRTPLEWSTVYVTGDAIRPETTYQVQAESVSGLQSTANAAITWPWGDLDGNGFVTLDDILLVLDAFGGNFVNVTLQQADITGCEPDGVINLNDILGVIDAFAISMLPCADLCP
jgi:hypothetical protein